MTQALSKNRSIESLYLSINQLNDSCLPNLLELLKVNRVLKKIYLGQNNISARASKELIKTAKEEYGVTLSV